MMSTGDGGGKLHIIGYGVLPDLTDIPHIL